MFPLDLGLGYGDGLETNSRIRSNYLARRAQFLGVAYVDNSGRQYYESSFWRAEGWLEGGAHLCPHR